jgi:hypothetical protein
MYLREIAVYADETIAPGFPNGFVGWFHRETCCVTELYISLLRRKVATPDTVKANLVFGEHEGLVPSLRQLITVADAKWPFSFSQYAGRDDGEKRLMILDAVHGCLTWIAKERSWDTRGLGKCYDEAISRNLILEGWSRKSWLSPDRRFRAKIGFRFGLRAVDFFVAVFDRQGRENGRKALGSVVPESRVASAILTGTGSWNMLNVFSLLITDDSHFYLPRAWVANLSDLVA